MNCVRKITVEPTMFLYMLGNSISILIQQSFFIYKACIINHGFNATICNCINEKRYKHQYDQVQITVSNFQQWNGIATYIVPIFLACFIGSWSDRHGRKLPLLIGILAKTYYTTLLTIITFTDWPLEYITYTATMPSAFMGANVAIFAASFSYISDISKPKNRTTRFAILEIIYLTSMPIGTGAGTTIFGSLENQSYTIMFAISTLSLLLAFVYSFVKLEWRTSEKQRPWHESDNNLCTDFFDKKHVTDSLRILIKPRSARRRTILYIILLTTSLYHFFKDETEKMYLYLISHFHWSAEQYNVFKTILTALFVPFILIGMPLMTNLFRLSDTVIILIGTISVVFSRLVYALATSGFWFYIGAAISGLCPIVTISARALISKIVSVTERGKIFSLLAVAENVMSLISEISYTQLYNHTYRTQPNAIFYLTLSTQILVLLLILFVHFYAKENSFQAENSDSVPDESKETQNNEVVQTEPDLFHLPELQSYTENITSQKY